MAGLHHLALPYPDRLSLARPFSLLALIPVNHEGLALCGLYLEQSASHPNPSRPKTLPMDAKFKKTPLAADQKIVLNGQLSYVL